MTCGGASQRMPTNMPLDVIPSLAFETLKNEAAKALVIVSADSL